jgi:hypothetical protein
MALPRRMDRAQRMRAQRLWWERNGSFFRGFLLGVALTAIAAWITVRFL